MENTTEHMQFNDNNKCTSNEQCNEEHSEKTVDLYETSNETQLQVSSNPVIRYIYTPLKVNIDKANMVIVMIFSFSSNGNVRYGASIYRKLNEKESFQKKKHRHTARERYNRYPNFFKINDFEKI